MMSYISDYTYSCSTDDEDSEYPGFQSNYSNYELVRLKDPKEYNCLTPVLHEVNRAVVAIREISKKKAVALADEVVSSIIQTLADGDEAFRKVYNGIRHVGSYYDGLRVTAPTEFDINIVLKFPFHKICKVEKSTYPGFVRVCVEGSYKSLISSIFRYSMDWTLKKIVDDSGYIRRDKVLEWWQSMFDRLIEKYFMLRINGKNYKIRWRTSGPAFTISIIGEDLTDRDLPIDIDLVPVLMFQDTDASSPSSVYKSWIEENRSSATPKQWYIVPKPLKVRVYYGSDSNRLWRLSFTDQEKVIISQSEHLKPTNRLIKRLRDNFGWHTLCSYHIKTVFITEAHKKKSSKEYAFFRHNLGYLFVYFLAALKDHLDRSSLPFFWDPGMNLFSQIGYSTQDNISFSMRRMLSKIHRHIDERDTTSLNNYIKSILIGNDKALNLQLESSSSCVIL